MENQHRNLVQNFDESKSEILKKRLLIPTTASATASLAHGAAQHSVLLNSLRTQTSNSMIVSSVHAPQCSIPISHNIVTHSIAPMKIHTNNPSYPMQLSTVHVQLPGSTSNINVPVQISGPTNNVPLQIAPVSLPIQMSTTGVPLQARDTINVPIHLPTSQNIQITPTLPSMPLLQNTNPNLHSSIIHVHMGTNSQGSIEANPELTNVHDAKPNCSQVQSSSQIPNSTNNPIQLALPSSGSSGLMRGSSRTVPHMVYIQTPTGLKPVTSTDVISQASTSGNPPQIIVRRPVTSNANIHVISNVNKPNIAPKVSIQNKSLLTPANAAQPIVIQKPKANEKMMVPVTIAPGSHGKQTIAYLGPIKKNTKVLPENNQSILISNNQSNINSNNQKLFLTPMHMPKIQNTKLIIPVTLPATMSSKGPIINLQIANGQIQNDPQGNITVMRDSSQQDSKDMPPLQPLIKLNLNGKDAIQNKGDKAIAITIPNSRAESTGEKEYTLSIPETNASMNDDVYTVSIANDENGQSREKSFTLAIPEKGRSLLNRNIIEKSDMSSLSVPAPAILRRSNSDNTDKKSTNSNMKRRVSLDPESFNKTSKPTQHKSQGSAKTEEQRVPSLFCDEQLDKDLEAKVGDPTNNANHKSLNEAKSNSSSNKNCVQDNGTKDENCGLIWTNGLAFLEGSNLRFQTDEFDLIQLVNSQEQAFMLNHRTNKHTDTRENKKRTNSPEDLYRCEACGCHGMAAEFITPNFCSSACRVDYQKSLQRKERLIEINKKKLKTRKTLIKSQSELEYDNDDDKLSLKQEQMESQDSAVKDDFTDEKYPWMCGKNGFSWMRYLDVCKAKAAPVKLFKDPFPYTRNGFKVGMRLEAIDPQHPSLFCVVSVAEVQGYRMRLHFDEYPDIYDYWVNADSLDLFPAGWCEKNGRVLQPPANFTQSTFSWPLYLKQMRAITAPRNLFTHIATTTVKPNSIRIGMKLEAEDRKNGLVCVASIADIIDNRLLVTFDSWDSMYDFWVDLHSPYIHPVGWAEENGLPLTPPNFFKDPDAFTWASYLAETGATAAPPRAFKPRPPAGFKPEMKLEAVDRRVPFLIRVATVSSVKDHQLRISFDGWPEEFSYWLDDDSPDIHPVGWCLKTGHPLEPPLTAEEAGVGGACGVGGCRGLGNARGAGKQHALASQCPYRARAHRPDRLARTPTAPHAPIKTRRLPGRPPKYGQSITPTSDTVKQKLPRGRPRKHKRLEEVASETIKTELCSDEDSLCSSGSKRWRRADSEAAVPPSAPVAHPVPLSHLVDELGLPVDPLQWKTGDVSSLVSRACGPAAGAAVAANRMRGAELVMASRDELVSCLQLRLGPAIKLYSLIRQLRDTLT